MIVIMTLIILLDHGCSHHQDLDKLTEDHSDVNITFDEFCFLYTGVTELLPDKSISSFTFHSNDHMDLRTMFKISISYTQSKSAFFYSISAHRHDRISSKAACSLTRKVILLALLMSGQIEPNPGPLPPCNICKTEIENGNQAVRCDNCSEWLHVNCLTLGMSKEICDVLRNQSNFSWVCGTCGLPNFSSTSFLTNSSIDISSNPFDSLLTLESDGNTSNDIDPGLPMATSTPSKPHQETPTKVSKRTTARKLKAMQINCDGLKGIKSRQQFEAEIEQHQPDLIFGCESKLDASIPTYSIFPDNYTVFRKDRNASGGGVFVAVKEDIVVVERAEFVTESEITWISVEFARSATLYLASFYRPPGYTKVIDQLANLHDSLSNILTKHVHTLPNIIIAGDFNFPDINWETLSATKSSTAGAHEKFIELLNEFGLMQLNPFVTRPKSNNILDLIVSSNEGLVTNVHTSPGISDHLIVNFELDVLPKSRVCKPRMIWKYDKADPSEVKQSIKKATDEYFSSPPEQRSLDENWSYFNKTVLETMDNCVPHKLSKGKISHPWISPPIVRQMRKRDKLYKRAKVSKKQQDWNKYKSQRNRVQRIVADAHTDYINNTIGKSLDGDGKKFWTYIKSKRKDSLGIPTLVTNSGVHFTNKSKATALNEQFASVFTKSEDLPVPQKGASPYPNIGNLTIESAGVAKQLRELKPNKASGPDDLPARMLHEYADDLAPMLTNIMQQSYNLGKLPSDWTKARVIGIYKKGDKTNPENYRPVSLTCICCKVQEHILLSHIAKHLSINSIIIDSQHGFREKLSCETQLLQAVDDWSNTLNQRGQADVLFLDFSKAFDRVPHQHLLHKLSYYGINGKTLGWIKGFLSERTQCVAVGGEESTWCPVTSGVPQGSVMGPVLFLLFINDITEDITSSIRLFADDSIIYRNIKSPEDQRKLHQDLLKVFEWAEAWGMNFNVKKCVHVTITKKLKPLVYNYTIGSEAIPKEQSTKYLGVTITADLSWSKHIETIRAKAARTLGLIRRNLGPCDPSVKEKAYQCLVRPQLEYGSCVWNPFTKRDKHMVEGVQRQAARFTKGDYKRTSSVSEMISSLQWDSLENRRLLSQVSMFFKICNGHVNIKLPDNIRRNERPSRSQHHLRFHHMQTNLDVYKYSFFPRIIPLWNVLPPEAISAKSPAAFNAVVLPFIRQLQPPTSGREW